MRPERYLALIQRDGARIAEVARAADLDRPVPTCPGWTVGDVVAHTAGVYRHKVACMRLQRPPGDDDYEQAPPPGVGLLDWFDASLALLVAELRERGPASPSYTWWPADRTVGFWYRRMAQETAVHRLDVEDGAGVPTPVDPDLALDGIDEVLDAFVADGWDTVTPEEWGGVDPHAGEGRTVAVRAGGRTWRTTILPDAMPLGRGDDGDDDGDADATVDGEPEPVLLWLWGRRPDASLALRGDRSVLAAFRDRLRIATQ